MYLSKNVRSTRVAARGDGGQATETDRGGEMSVGSLMRSKSRGGRCRAMGAGGTCCG